MHILFILKLLFWGQRYLQLSGQRTAKVHICVRVLRVEEGPSKSMNF